MVRAIKSQKRNKAPGIDRIPGEVFKLFNSKLLSILVFLFNHIMDKESYPENCSTGIIIPIFKKGDRTLPKNYRGSGVGTTGAPGAGATLYFLLEG